jgi:site-specific DNA-cytosine methylase
MKKDETILDLYCGMGGLGTGFSDYFAVTEAVDIWHDACLTYQSNHSDAKVREKSVSDFISSCIPKDFNGILYNGVFQML